VIWSSIHADEWWPLLLAIGALAVLAAVWLRRKGTPFPDVVQAERSRKLGGLVDCLPLVLGLLTSLLLVLAMMEISVSRTITTESRARDFLVVVDTSRSMRENTPLLREQFPPVYQRRAGLYVGQTDDPSTIPHLARYEIARESLLQYLSARTDEDRVALVYFNSLVYVLSGFTSNFDFIEQQLAGMDPYVTYGTNIRWALEQGLDMIERYPGRNRRALILLTDAEARDTADLQQQFDRMRRLDVAFYLLWIAADAGDGSSPMATTFLQSARALGSVFTIDELKEGYLEEALGEIADLEDYAYEEVRHERVDISRYCFDFAAFLMLIWILLTGTLYLPLKRVTYASSQHD
jgi:hypothetical protein